MKRTLICVLLSALGCVAAREQQAPRWKLTVTVQEPDGHANTAGVYLIDSHLDFLAVKYGGVTHFDELTGDVGVVVVPFNGFRGAFTPQLITGLSRPEGPERNLVVQLAHGEQISGRVVDKRGAGVPRAKVHVWHANLPSWLTSSGPSWPDPGDDIVWRDTCTDADGRFAIGGLLPGKHVVKVMDKLTDSSSYGFVSSGNVQAEAGDADVVLVTREAGTVVFRFLDGVTGRPVESEVTWTAKYDDLEFGGGGWQRDGEVEYPVHVPPGIRVVFEFNAAGYVKPAPITVELGEGERTQIDVRFPRGSRVTAERD